MTDAEGAPRSGVEGGGRRPARDELPPWVPRAIRLVIFWVVVTSLGIYLVFRLEDLVRYLVLALFLAFALEPGVQWLHTKHDWKRGTATGLILCATVAVGVVMVLYFIPRAIAQVDRMVEQIPAWVDDINEWSQDVFGDALISESSEESTVETADLVRNFITDYADDLLGLVSGAIEAIFSIFTVLLFAFYLTANGPGIRRAIASVLRPESQRRVLWAWEESVEKTGGYLYSRMLLAMINGSAIFVVMVILDVPFALSLAIFTGVVAAFIPIIGTYIAGAVPTFVALVTVGPTAALWILVEILIYQQVENIWLSPRLSQKTIDLNAGLAYGVAMAGGALGGIVAAFFALPVAAVMQSFIANFAKRYEVVDSNLTRAEAGDEDEAPKSSPGPLDRLRARFRPSQANDSKPADERA